MSKKNSKKTFYEELDYNYLDEYLDDHILNKIKKQQSRLTKKKKKVNKEDIIILDKD